MAATYELTEASRRGREEQEKLLAEFELRRKIRAAVVPTDDAKVRALLRQLSEPVTLFGEREMERRERLKKIVAERGGDVDALEGAPVTGALVVEEAVAVHKETFHTEGPPELKEARLAVARWSLKRAAARVHGAKRLAGDVEALKAAKAARDATEAAAKRVAQQSSEVADDRPVGGCAFAPDGALLAACGWGGQVNLWRATDSANVSRLRGFRAHAERATGIAWHPRAAPGAHGGGGGGADDHHQQQQQQQQQQEPGSACLLTGCADGTAALFSLSGARLRELRGHTDRLGRVAWHPMGAHVATPSYDLTWRLWDVETGACLLEQEGHSRAVYAVAFHPDGALAASAGLDAVGRVWDCRTGRTAHVLEGHVKGILSADFSPDGHTLATGGDDHTVRVWDLRKRACVYVIPAHRSLVSAVRWHPVTGHVLLTAGYDAAVKLWSGRDWSLLKALAGHEGKVMAADIAPLELGAAAAAADSKRRQQQQDGGDVSMDDAEEQQQQHPELLIGSAGYDRTVKLWSPQDVLGVLGGGGGEDLPF